ncbi:hypothetical protein SARC_12277, partial [Sphaeroforma arctica JP610]
VPTHLLGTHTLRSHISVIPQEPVLFSGTIRSNLDPFNEHSDEVLLKALADVQLKDLTESMGNGLYSVVTEDGGNLSIGQKQLFCLCRAILSHNKILIMDEATANVDNKTDQLISSTLRQLFTDCTILTIVSTDAVVTLGCAWQVMWAKDCTCGIDYRIVCEVHTM